MKEIKSVLIKTDKDLELVTVTSKTKFNQHTIVGNVMDRTQFTHSMHFDVNKARILVAATQNEQQEIGKGYQRSVRIVNINLTNYDKPLK